MNFEYDFKDGHTRFSYRSKPGEVLDDSLRQHRNRAWLR